MWSFLRGKKRPESTGQEAPSRDDALSALARERRGERSGDQQEASASPDPAPAAPRREEPPAEPARTGGYEVVLDHRFDEVGAGIAPEQDEDGVPVVRREHRPLSREDGVADALDRWAQQITGGVTAPSFLTQIRAGGTVLDLTHSHPSGLARLLAGRGPTRLSSLVREVGALADARAHARTIREVAERHAEEVGLTTCHLGIGEAIWYPEDGSEPIHAPVLVRPVTLRLRGNAREDVDLEVDATADLNPVLLRALREAGVAVDARAPLATTDGAHGFDPNPVLDAFRSLGQPLTGFRVLHALVVGNMMDAAGSVAEDLAEAREDWAASPLVAALAGDETARTEVRGAEQGMAPEVPEDELVAAVDPGHRAVLERVLAGGDLAVPTPPGTSSLDLVVDLAEELNARGKSVLIVSQRRRNLSQLVEIARRRGLEELVFDLSPDPSLRPQRLRLAVARPAPRRLPRTRSGRRRARGARRQPRHPRRPRRGDAPDPGAVGRLRTRRDLCARRADPPPPRPSHLRAPARLRGRADGGGGPRPLRRGGRARPPRWACSPPVPSRPPGTARRSAPTPRHRGPRSSWTSRARRDPAAACVVPVPAPAASWACASPRPSSSSASASRRWTGCRRRWAPSSPPCSPPRRPISSPPPPTSAGARSAAWRWASAPVGG
ncbi:DUF4011 domain-containing protein [Brachybacterium sp. GPGPB12]|uniref:DUF4011 domain-containing protein n=1 Tax=Brachybacterium sp. GPGPB12 TaxID=3023517 RepID=UPI00313450FE